MARITVEDCLENVENRFELVMIATRRARQLQSGGKDPYVSVDNDKPAVLALREIADRHVDASILDEAAVQEADDNLAALEAAAAAAADIEEVMDVQMVPDEETPAAEDEVEDSTDNADADDTEAQEEADDES